VAEGTLPDAMQVRAKIGELTGRGDECRRLLALLESEVPELRQNLSKQQAMSVAGELRRRLLNAPRSLQKRYVRGLVSDIIVTAECATISGPPLALAMAATSPESLGEVRSSVRDWRTRRDSNSRPSDS